MNKSFFMGRLTRDPEVRHTTKQDGTDMAIARWTLAVDRRGARSNNDGQQTADFINCVAFGKGAEIAEKYYQKGTKLVICARVQTGSYTNRDGQKVYTTDFVVEESAFAESKSAAGPQARQNAGSGEGFMQIPDGADFEGLPFN